MTGQRYSPRAIMGDAANDTYALRTVGGVPMWLPVREVPPGGTTGQVLTKATGTDYDADWETPASGGGSGSGAGYDFDGKGTIQIPASTNSMNDEFNDATGSSGPVNGLAAKWSKHNLATPSWLVLDDTKGPGALLLNIPNAQSGDQAIYQAAPAGAFRISARLEVAVSGRQMWGLFCVDTSGNGIAINIDDLTHPPQLRVLAAWLQTATAVNANTNAVGGKLNFTLTRNGTTYTGQVWAGDRMLPGGVFEVSTTSAITPAYVGIGRFFGGGAATVAVDWFRVN